ncbi:MAG: hypothetical protein H7Y16_08315 [Candidatus Parcubacteria bacterium]|nr:hypothetical protein [Burkholderiales bacterium]
MIRSSKLVKPGPLKWSALFLVSLLLGGGRSQAADPSVPQVWLNPGVFSYHFDRNKDLREDNTGVGVEVVMHDDHSLQAGTIINSDRQRSRYAAYHWRPLHWDVAGFRVSAGLALGAFDGYPRYRDGGWFIAPLPIVAVEGKRFGANIAVIPTLGNRLNGAVAVQFKLRVW